MLFFSDRFISLMKHFLNFIFIFCFMYHIWLGSGLIFVCLGAILSDTQRLVLTLYSEIIPCCAQGPVACKANVYSTVFSFPPHQGLLYF